eukprot:COSAG01_NODE_28082_length_669_cov_2.545614_1_plen_153_part_10
MELAGPVWPPPEDKDAEAGSGQHGSPKQNQNQKKKAKKGGKASPKAGQGGDGATKEFRLLPAATRFCEGGGQEGGDQEGGGGGGGGGGGASGRCAQVPISALRPGAVYRLRCVAAWVVPDDCDVGQAGPAGHGKAAAALMSGCSVSEEVEVMA